MEYSDFLKYHHDRNKIHTLYNSHFWVSCSYSKNNEYSNIKPRKVEFKVDPIELDNNGMPVIEIFNLDNKGNRLKTKTQIKDIYGNFIHVFYTEKEAIDNYKHMNKKYDNPKDS